APDVGPFRGEDPVGDGRAEGAVREETVVAEHRLPDRSETRDRPLGPLVPKVRPEADPVDLLGLERVSEQKELRFRVDRRPPKVRVEPGAPDLDREVRSVDVEESGHPDGSVVRPERLRVAGGEGDEPDPSPRERYGS